MAQCIYTAFKWWELGASLHPILGREFVTSCPGMDYQKGILMVREKWTSVRLSMWPESQKHLKQTVAQ